MPIAPVILPVAAMQGPAAEVVNQLDRRRSVNGGLDPGSPYNTRSQYVSRNDCSASTRVSSASCAPEDRSTATVKRTCGIPTSRIRKKSAYWSRYWVISHVA